MRLREFVGAAAVALCLAASAQELRVASAAETRAALLAEDDWLSSLSPFQRAAAVGRNGPVSREEFRQALQQVARECTEGEVKRWRTAFDQVMPRIRELRIRLPAAVMLACTTGLDSEGHPYTRGDAIFMPPGRGEPGPRDPFVMAHELFHIYSRRNPAVASELYGLLGFRDAPLLAWPAEWRDERIANPDAPLDRHTMDIESGGQAYTVMPVLVARRAALRPGESFFSVMDVRLLAVERSADGRWSVPVRRDGQLVWFDANRNESYLRQLGGNSSYVIHPEETTADNVAMLVTGVPGRNPALIERIRQALISKAPTP